MTRQLYIEDYRRSVIQHSQPFDAICPATCWLVLFEESLESIIFSPRSQVAYKDVVSNTQPWHGTCSSKGVISTSNGYIKS